MLTEHVISSRCQAAKMRCKAAVVPCSDGNRGVAPAAAVAKTSQFSPESSGQSLMRTCINLLAHASSVG